MEQKKQKQQKMPYWLIYELLISFEAKLYVITKLIPYFLNIVLK